MGYFTVKLTPVYHLRNQTNWKAF